MAKFTKELMKTVLNWEGGYSNDQVDSGNYDSIGRLIGTNHGIAAQTLEGYYLKSGITLKTKPENEVILLMKDLTTAEAQIIAKTMFWDEINGDLFKNQSVAEITFQWKWGSGYFGEKWEQGAIKAALGIPLTVDYKITPEEITLLNAVDQEKLFDTIKDEYIKFLTYIVQQSADAYRNKCKAEGRTPAESEVYQNTYLKYETGWKRRVNSYQYTFNP